MKRFLTGVATASLALAAGTVCAQPVEPVDLDMVSRIRQEAFHHSQVMGLLGLDKTVTVQSRTVLRNQPYDAQTEAAGVGNCA